MDNGYSLVNKYGCIDVGLIRSAINIEYTYVSKNLKETWSLLLKYLDGLAYALQLPIIAIVSMDDIEYYLKAKYRMFERLDGKTLVTKSLKEIPQLNFNIEK